MEVPTVVYGGGGSFRELQLWLGVTPALALFMVLWLSALRTKVFSRPAEYSSTRRPFCDKSLHALVHGLSVLYVIVVLAMPQWPHWDRLSSSAARDVNGSFVGTESWPCRGPTSAAHNGSDAPPLYTYSTKGTVLVAGMMPNSLDCFVLQGRDSNSQARFLVLPVIAFATLCFAAAYKGYHLYQQWREDRQPSSRGVNSQAASSQALAAAALAASPLFMIPVCVIQILGTMGSFSHQTLFETGHCLTVRGYDGGGCMHLMGYTRRWVTDVFSDHVGVTLRRHLLPDGFALQTAHLDLEHMMALSFALGGINYISYSMLGEQCRNKRVRRRHKRAPSPGSRMKECLSLCILIPACVWNSRSELSVPVLPDALAVLLLLALWLFAILLSVRLATYAPVPSTRRLSRRVIYNSDLCYWQTNVGIAVVGGGMVGVVFHMWFAAFSMWARFLFIWFWMAPRSDAAWRQLWIEERPVEEDIMLGPDRGRQTGSDDQEVDGPSDDRADAIADDPDDNLGDVKENEATTLEL